MIPHTTVEKKTIEWPYIPPRLRDLCRQLQLKIWDLLLQYHHEFTVKTAEHGTVWDRHSLSRGISRSASYSFQGQPNHHRGSLEGTGLNKGGSNSWSTFLGSRHEKSLTVHRPQHSPEVSIMFSIFLKHYPLHCDLEATVGWGRGGKSRLRWRWRGELKVSMYYHPLFQFSKLISD